MLIKYALPHVFYQSTLILYQYRETVEILDKKVPESFPILFRNSWLIGLCSSGHAKVLHQTLPVGLALIQHGLKP